jgi:ATP-dependent RNA helicase DeaD
VATDVAARGLDVKDITHIINYNLPDEVDLYIHRSGRTGRAGQHGVSVAIVNLREKNKIRMIEARLRRKFEQKQVPTGKEICEKQLLNLVDRMQKIEVDHKEIDKFLPVVAEKLEWLSRDELIKHIVSLEFNRLLDYYKDAKDLNPPEEDRSRRKRFDKEGSRNNDSRRMTERGFTRFRINLGHKDSLNPRDLIGLINRCTHKRYMDIGKIDLMNTFSFFEVDQKYAGDVLAGFRGIEYNQRNVIVEMQEAGAEQQRETTKRPGYESRRDRKQSEYGGSRYNTASKKKRSTFSNDRELYSREGKPAKRQKAKRTKRPTGR